MSELREIEQEIRQAGEDEIANRLSELTVFDILESLCDEVGYDEVSLILEDFGHELRES